MTVPEGSLARGGVQIFPYTVTAGTITKFDLTPGAYDIHVINVSATTDTTAKVELYTNPEQTAVDVLWLAKTSDSSVVSALTVQTSTANNVVVVPRGANYVPFVIPYGIRLRHLNAGTFSGFLVARRR